MLEPSRPPRGLFDDAPLIVFWETFTALRDPEALGGKCGVCEFRRVCGGSRARAYAMTGDLFAEEPACSYQPRAAVTAS